MKYSFLFLSFFIVLSTAFIAGCSHHENQLQNTVNQPSHEDPDGYWTCPMHPQVHQHEKGKCPICGMDLVHVEGEKSLEKDSPVTNSLPNPNGIQVSNQQLERIAIGRYTVSRKDLAVSIPVAGSILSSKEVVLQIYESDLRLIKTDNKFVGSLSSSPQDSLKGKITRIDSTIDPASRTLKVFGVLDQPVQYLVSDGSFHGEIIAQLKNQIVIPQDAVLHTGRRDLVYLFSSNNHLRPQPVTLGSKSSAEYQVFAGLNDGDVISSGPNFLFDSESKIRGSDD